jgi:predicted RNA-binding Zn ribbon-like protein
MPLRKSISTEFDQTRGALIGGRLAIDFANLSLASEDAAAGNEAWERLLAILVTARTISIAKADGLGGLSRFAPDETAKLVHTARDLGRALRQIFAARLAGDALEPEWIAQINTVLACTEGYDRLEVASDAGKRAPKWKLRLAARSEGLEWLLAAIARSAAELVVEGPAAPVRKCANPKCGLYFYDDSPTRRRRWCSMATCGNRAKVAAHYKRAR